MEPHAIDWSLVCLWLSNHWCKVRVVSSDPSISITLNDTLKVCFDCGKCTGIPEYLNMTQSSNEMISACGNTKRLCDSENKETLSIDSFNRLVFLIETRCFSYSVRSSYLTRNLTHTNRSSFHASK